jgi:hypothetical protein
MADFNVYKWRRDMIQENVGADDLESIKKLPFNQAIKAYYGGSEPTKKEVEIFTDLYFGNPTSLNESDLIVKKIKDLTVQDVTGVYLPNTKNSATGEYIDSRPIFDDNWRQVRLDRWRNTLYQDSPGSEEWEVTIGKNSINRKVLDFGNNPEAQKYKEAEEKRTQAAQADYAANKGSYRGD